MKYVNYAALKNVMLTQKPYRGSTNRFPLSRRTQSYKYFLHGEDEKGEYMRLIYGKRFSSEEVTEAEHIADPVNVRKYKRPNDPQGYFYMKYTQTPNELGIVRADNSFEFSSKGYGQGDRTMLSDFSWGTLKTDCRRGGMIYYDRNGFMLPIVENMRVDCNTMLPDPSHQYRLLGRRVNRKKSKEFLKQYEEFFKVSEVMMKNVGKDVFIDIALEHVQRIASASVGKYWLEGSTIDDLLAEAKKLMNDSPLDAAALFCCALGRNGINEFWWRLRNLRHHTEGVDIGEMYVPMRNHVCNMLYRENPEVFSEIEFEIGKTYPASTWGYVVEVDGKAVRQFV